ncbi:MAG: hypothetical protein JKY01_01685 [Pseudomonadales bacterium]|nr:hypothetical protein [Pseudomonadales bacterium]
MSPNKPAFSQTKQTSARQQCVIILHGLGRTRLAMQAIQKTLTHDGYQVWSESYPSTLKDISQLATETINEALSYCRSYNSTHIHFVTHSLGGILLRYYLQDQHPKEPGYIVMLSPPNHGSEVVDHLKNNKLFQYFLGPAGQQLGTDKNSIPNTLKPVNAVIGIITGNNSFEPWFSNKIPGQDDGKVSTESAKLTEMRDYLVIKSGHTFIMNNSYAIEQIQYFLKHGKFLRAP